MVAVTIIEVIALRVVGGVPLALRPAVVIEIEHFTTIPAKLHTIIIGLTAWDPLVNSIAINLARQLGVLKRAGTTI